MRRKKLIAAAVILGLAVCMFGGCSDKQRQGGDVSGGDSIQIANPVRNITESESHELCHHSLGAPEGAKNVSWSAIETGSSENDGVLVQMSFDLDNNSYTARAQKTDTPDADISGMYYDWVASNEMPLTSWKQIKGNYYRWFDVSSSEGYADLCTWYDGETGISYSLSVTADDLDGFDLQAIVEYLYAPEK